MVVKQQPFADAEVVTAVNNNVMRKIPLDHEEFKLYPKLQLKLNMVFLPDIHNHQRQISITLCIMISYPIFPFYLGISWICSINQTPTKDANNRSQAHMNLLEERIGRRTHGTFTFESIGCCNSIDA